MRRFFNRQLTFALFVASSNIIIVAVAKMIEVLSQLVGSFCNNLDGLSSTTT